MLGYDTNFTAIATADRAEMLRKSYAAGRVPYRSDDGRRDRVETRRPVLAAALGTTGQRCHPDLSQRAA